MFCEVAENQIFRNQFGDLILSGAIGVDKWKEVDGVLEHHLRHISILTRLTPICVRFAAIVVSSPKPVSEV